MTTKEYFDMLKKVSVRQDISDVKNSAVLLAARIRSDGSSEDIMDSNTIYALLDYIEALENDLAQAYNQIEIPSRQGYMPDISD